MGESNGSPSLPLFILALRLLSCRLGRGEGEGVQEGPGGPFFDSLGSHLALTLALLPSSLSTPSLLAPNSLSCSRLSLSTGSTSSTLSHGLLKWPISSFARSRTSLTPLATARASKGFFDPLCFAGIILKDIFASPISRSSEGSRWYGGEHPCRVIE